MDLSDAGNGSPRWVYSKEHPAMTTRNLILALAAVPALLAATACNTVDGMGDDLKSASKEVEEEI
jgi:predicted small secreted protein